MEGEEEEGQHGWDEEGVRRMSGEEEWRRSWRW